MPRYFFHVYNGTALFDEEGTELSGLDEAGRVARETTGEIIRDGGIKPWQVFDCHMEVTDAAGQVMLKLYFFYKDLSGETP
ncbi:DUF6894 family protein [Microvirga aerophila]|uniref:DUF6894 domain-containing protein n=1 Tax=Microvirga aerophila TaxID=670291 RepID=A0A512C4F5_9HYPH|nr:hypothetical protein [Microvirga aerophila]GEO19068.1 hypothetical protein MAE02_67640 [Microvirga aerophila]